MKNNLLKFAQVATRRSPVILKNFVTPSFSNRAIFMQTNSFRMMSTNVVDSTTYIKEMKDQKDWQAAMEVTSRPVLI